MPVPQTKPLTTGTAWWFIMNPYLRQEKRNDLPSTCITTNSFAIVTRNYNQRPINDRRKRMRCRKCRAVINYSSSSDGIHWSCQDCATPTKKECD
jgi:hypothetical protein